jgi:hypothetical protein
MKIGSHHPTAASEIGEKFRLELRHSGYVNIVNIVKVIPILFPSQLGASCLGHLFSVRYCFNMLVLGSRWR